MTPISPTHTPATQPTLTRVFSHLSSVSVFSIPYRQSRSLPSQSQSSNVLSLLSNLLSPPSSHAISSLAPPSRSQAPTLTPTQTNSSSETPQLHARPLSLFPITISPSPHPTSFVESHLTRLPHFTSLAQLFASYHSPLNSSTPQTSPPPLPRPYLPSSLSLPSSSPVLVFSPHSTPSSATTFLINAPSPPLCSRPPLLLILPSSPLPDHLPLYISNDIPLISSSIPTSTNTFNLNSPFFAFSPSPSKNGTH
ncbi:hypothetical protein Tco_0643804 [Tanacetum coccineum]